MTTVEIKSYSYTELDDYSRCPLLYRFRHIDKIQRKRRDPALRKGSAIHRLLQAHNLGEFVNAEYVAMLEEIEENPNLFEDEKQEQIAELDDAFRIVEGYIAYYGDEGFEVLHVEEQFEVVLSTGHTITVTPDLVVRDRQGRVWSWDYKSTTAAPTHDIPFTDLQAVMQYAAVRALYPEAVGMVYDRMRKKVPTEPRLNKTGDRKVNNLKRIDTTFEILRDFLTEEAPDLLDDPEHRMRLAELRDENRFYYREEVFITDEHLSNALDDIVEKIETLEFTVGRARFARNYLSSGFRSCDRCEMNSICRGELLGWDTERILRDEYEPRDMSYKEYETEEEDDD